MTIRVEEKSLQLALVKAAGQLGVTQEALAYQIIEQSRGFLGIFGKKIAIKAWKKSTARSGGGNHKKPRGESSQHRPRTAKPAVTLDPMSREQVEELKKRIHAFATGLCERIAGEDVTVNLTEDQDRLIVDVDSQVIAEQIGKNARFAEALEHLIRKQPRDIRQEWPFRLFVDACRVRQAREEELVGMAKSLSDKVSENRKPIVLNYRSSYDRKIIHMALDRDSRVFTKSIGSGPNRKLMILPSKEMGQEASV